MPDNMLNRLPIRSRVRLLWPSARPYRYVAVLSALAMVARPRPVAPYYLMLSTMLQPEFSAVLVGTKTPRQAVAQARYQVDHLLKGIR